MSHVHVLSFSAYHFYYYLFIYFRWLRSRSIVERRIWLRDKKKSKLRLRSVTNALKNCQNSLTSTASYTTQKMWHKYRTDSVKYRLRLIRSIKKRNCLNGRQLLIQNLIRYDHHWIHTRSCSIPYWSKREGEEGRREERERGERTVDKCTCNAYTYYWMLPLSFLFSSLPLLSFYLFSFSLSLVGRRLRRSWWMVHSQSWKLKRLRLKWMSLAEKCTNCSKFSTQKQNKWRKRETWEEE